ncbi:hypothetical protein [Nitrospira sp. Ecomares 2.1]
MAGHRFGSFTPSFDGVQLTLGGDESSGWGLRAFVTQSVQRHTVRPDWTSPINYFSGAAISSPHVPWANGELYLNEFHYPSKGKEASFSWSCRNKIEFRTGHTVRNRTEELAGKRVAKSARKNLGKII